VDASCGSGLFTRRFLKSGNYGCVVALDFSPAMLTQARQFAKDEELLYNDVGEEREDLAGGVLRPSIRPTLNRRGAH
jgi:SAM-dependent methyltransferase